jgi:hypothetical protein
MEVEMYIERDHTLTPVEAAVILAQTLLCRKSQWQGADTYPADIDRAVDAAQRAMEAISDRVADDARTVIRRRAGSTNL